MHNGIIKKVKKNEKNGRFSEIVFEYDEDKKLRKFTLDSYTGEN